MDKKVLSVFEEKKDEKREWLRVIKGEEGDEKGVSKVLSVFEEEKSENSASKVLEGCKKEQWIRRFWVYLKRKRTRREWLRVIEGEEGQMRI